MPNIDFIFIGGTQRGYKLLEDLVRQDRLPGYAVILQEDDHEHDRYSTKMAALAQGRGIKHGIKKKVDQEDLKIINSQKWDFAIVCGWRTIIPTVINGQFKLGMLAAHDSLLPKYRGFAPLNWAIINGESEIGVTLFRIAEGEVDSGDIIKQTRIRVEPSEYAIDVFHKVTQATLELYRDLFEDYLRGQVQFTRQNEAEATYTCKRTPDDGKIDWSKSAREIFNLIRALAHPYPGAHCQYDGRTYRIRKVEPGNHGHKVFAGSIPGRVISLADESAEVLCGQGTIKITEWECNDGPERPGKVIRSITATLK